MPRHFPPYVSPVSGLRAVKKIHSSSSQQNLQTRDGISFVTVYTIYNSSIGSDSSRIHDGSSELVTVANSSDSIAERSVAILNVFIDVIQAFLEGRLQEHSKGLRIYSHYIFAVSDIAVVDDLGNIFHKYPDFHLALTFRNNKYQPLKSGFVAVRGTADGIYRAKIFLEEVLNVYSLKFMKASRMLGDQLALAWVVKSHLPFAPRKFSMHEAFSGEINGVSILFLPCSVYNWTPPEGAGQFHGMPLDVQAIHFKGSRKRLKLAGVLEFL
ncbi:hypothetical protein MUK42_01692 [Musa troglodytarum]|uniref:Uncharacterized protein n=1 Tax=Musa troglodytarum TaxID=320322 RepID=A0A9E7L576_9LILI|nr:hypothetical protein MUK42_01692 [Musa troglodytarum]